jgi:3-dehydroquinate synthase
VRLIRIPTTTLSQNDSGVGVKNGINYYNKKNFIGSFYPPTAVINDYNFLKTLLIKDWVSGIPESLKVSLIKTKRFFFYMCGKTQDILNRKVATVNEIDYLCAKLHIEHIGLYGDPFEVYSARPLDFGHWSAHKLEATTKNKITHGHAVAIGIAIDCTYSFFTNLITEKEWKEILYVLLNLNFNIYNKKLAAKKSCILIQGLTEFKEHLGGILTITLLHKIGKGITVNKMDTVTIKKTILLLKKIQKTYNIKKNED